MSPFGLFVLATILGVLVALIQVGLLTIAFDKLGLSATSAALLLLASLLGSFINMPLFRLKTLATLPPSQIPLPLRQLLQMTEPDIPLRTTVAVNVGGCLVPVSFSAYLIGFHSLNLWSVVLGTSAMTLISYMFSRPIPGLGIGMPMLIAPVCAALIALLINAEQSAPLAYTCGTLGVLIGADLLRLKDIRYMGAPMASIGGAGTFDGIFVTGVVAVLLA